MLAILPRVKNLSWEGSPSFKAYKRGGFDLILSCFRGDSERHIGKARGEQGDICILCKLSIDRYGDKVSGH